MLDVPDVSPTDNNLVGETLDSSTEFSRLTTCIALPPLCPNGGGGGGGGKSEQYSIHHYTIASKRLAAQHAKE